MVSVLFVDESGHVDSWSVYCLWMNQVMLTHGQCTVCG